MIEETKLTTEFIDALFNPRLAKQLGCFFAEDLRNIESNQVAPSTPCRKAFLRKLLADAEKLGLDVSCRYFADAIELFITNGEAGMIEMTLDDLDKLTIEHAIARRVLISEFDNSLYCNMENFNLDFLLKHGFRFYGMNIGERYERYERDYRPFDLNKGFEFELGWFSNWIELTSRLNAENDMFLKKYKKMRKIAELKSEIVDKFD